MVLDLSNSSTRSAGVLLVLIHIPYDAYIGVVALGSMWAYIPARNTLSEQQVCTHQCLFAFVQQALSHIPESIRP